MTLRSRLTGGVYAQIVAQVLTAFAVLMHLVRVDDVSVWVITPLVAALLVPFRHDGSLKDRATGNFAAAWLVAGIFAWESMIGGLGGVFGGIGGSTGAFLSLTLSASVLFSTAGAVFWTAREQTDA